MASLKQPPEPMGAASLIARFCREVSTVTIQDDGASRARRGMLEFATYTKPDYDVNWHHRVLCDYLDRFVRGEIKRLMVFMPPRTGKSELVSRRLPAYIMGNNPDAQIIACSYSADLASRMNRDVQRIIDDDRYHSVFPDTHLFGSNVRTVAKGSYLRNSDIFEVVGHKGVYRSAGVGGGITGMGMHYGIIDDPIKNRQEANSQVYRDSIWEWYTSTFYTRLEKGGCVLLTVTRWHEDDLAGRLLNLAKSNPDADQWTVVNFPAVCEDPKSQEDPREIGEPLWPNKFDSKTLEKIRLAVGSYDWASMYQQRPQPAGGGLFKREYFRYFEEEPDFYVLHRHDGDQTVTHRIKRSECSIRTYVDAAQKAGEQNDYFVASTWAITKDKDALLIDVFRTKLEGPDQPPHMRNVYRRYKGVIGIEDKSAGSTLIQTLKREGLPIRAIQVDTDKVTRALPAAARYEAGTVYHRQGASWLQAWEDELTGFPNAANDDQVDTASMMAADLSGISTDTGVLEYYRQIKQQKQEQEG